MLEKTIISCPLQHSDCIHITSCNSLGFDGVDMMWIIKFLNFVVKFVVVVVLVH